MSTFVLDGARIYRLCTENQVSQLQLGSCIGASGLRVARLLAGAGADALTLRELSRLGERLGVDPLSLLVARGEQAEPNAHEVADAAKVHAVLGRQRASVSRQEVARVLDWELRRTTAALRELERSLEGTGEVLHQVNASFFQLRARDEVLTDAHRERADQIRLHKTGLDIRSARLLLELVEAGGEKATQNARAVAELGSLINQGIASRDASGKVTLNRDVLFSLGISEAA